MAEIKNINGKQEPICKCGSWLNHWNNFNPKPAVFCAEIRCTQMFKLKGVHVQQPNDENWYIVPLCEKHSICENELTIVNSIQLVTDNVKITCDKE